MGIALCLAGATATQGLAASIEFFFTGVVDEVSPPLESVFSIGDGLAGSYTIDSTTPALPTGPGVGAFNAVTSISITIGGYAATATGDKLGFITLFDNVVDSIDTYAMNTGIPGAPPVGGRAPFVFGLAASGKDLFLSTALPLSLPPIGLDVFADTFGLSFAELGAVRGVLTSLTVPGPGGLTLLAVSFGAFGAWTWCSGSWRQRKMGTALKE
jgi:hypothetical protein